MMMNAMNATDRRAGREGVCQPTCDARGVRRGETGGEARRVSGRATPASDFIRPPPASSQNTNIDGRKKVMFAITSIKGVGRRFANIVCKKAAIDITKRCVSELGGLKWYESPTTDPQRCGSRS